MPGMYSIYLYMHAKEAGHTDSELKVAADIVPTIDIRCSVWSRKPNLLMSIRCHPRFDHIRCLGVKNVKVHFDTQCAAGDGGILTSSCSAQQQTLQLPSLARLLLLSQASSVLKPLPPTSTKLQKPERPTLSLNPRSTVQSLCEFPLWSQVNLLGTVLHPEFQYRISVLISVISLYFSKLISVISDVSYFLCRFAMSVSIGISTRHGGVGRASVGWMEHIRQRARR